MSNRDFDCPACNRFGYDPGFKCLHCGYLEGEGLTSEEIAKLDSLQGPYLKKPDSDVEANDVYPMAPKPNQVVIQLGPPKLSAGSFSPATPYMLEIEKERRENKPADIQVAYPHLTAADKRSRSGMRSKVERPPVTLNKDDFMERSSAELLSSRALRRVHAVLCTYLESYWASNKRGDVTWCEELEGEIAAYLKSLPAEYRRRPKGTDKALVARVLIRYSRTGKSG